MQTLNETENIYTMAEAEPEDLSRYLIDRYSKLVPPSIESGDDLAAAGRMLSRLTNEKTFLYSLLCYLKVKARKEKGKGKDNKAAAEDMAMRRDSVEIILDSVKSQYDAMSRMITSYKMQLDEMRMMGRI